MKGIVLAGGTGSRLGPLTRATHKHLLPVYDKPMIYYPMATLIEAGVKELLIITCPEHAEAYRQLLEDGRKLGVSIQYVTQDEPKGIPQALTLGKSFIGQDPVCLILGDNIFIARELPGMVREAMASNQGATVFTHRVDDASQFGVLSLHPDGKPKAIIEKPEHPESNLAVTGLYVYHPEAVGFVEAMGHGESSELIISVLNQKFIDVGRLKARALPDDSFWADAGTPAGLLKAANHIKRIQNEQGRRFACIEEAALRQGLISYAELQAIAAPLKNSEYGQYLLGLLQHEETPPQKSGLRLIQ